MLGIIISIVATAIISVLIAIWQMKKNRIDHYFINSYDIGKGLTDEFPDFSLHYGDEMLVNNVKVLQGGFMNTGNRDIGDDGKLTGFKLILPNGCVVKNAKVSPLKNGLKVNCPIKNEDCWIIEQKREENELCFEIDGVMKSKEWFNYTAIIETPNGMGDLYKQLGLDHRIKDTTLRHLYLGPYYKKKLSSSKTMVIMSVLYFPLFLSMIIFICLKPEHLFNAFDFTKVNNLFVFMILFMGQIILSGICFAVLAERWGRRGRVANELMKKKSSSDYYLFESLFVG